MLKNGGKFHPKLDATLIEDDSIKAHLKRPNEAWDGGLMTLSGNKFGPLSANWYQYFKTNHAGQKSSICPCGREIRDYIIGEDRPQEEAFSN